MRDNFEEYQNPVEYDAESGGFEHGGPFYLGLAREVGGPVLELGCGTGRIAIPMAQAGLAVTGLDLVPGMLERARAKGQGLPIRWVEGDCRDFDLGEQYGLIFLTGHSVQHLHALEDLERMLAAVRRHLAPGGLFAFETRNPNLEHLLANQTEEDWHTYTGPQDGEVRVSGFQEYDHAAQLQTWTTIRRSGSGVRTSGITLRYWFPQELEALLHYNGFQTVRRYGNWDFSPLSAASPEIICVCRAK